jgi:hypothetical protein
MRGIDATPRGLMEHPGHTKSFYVGHFDFMVVLCLHAKHSSSGVQLPQPTTTYYYHVSIENSIVTQPPRLSIPDAFHLGMITWIPASPPRGNTRWGRNDPLRRSTVAPPRLKISLRKQDTDTKSASSALASHISIIVFPAPEERKTLSHMPICL